MWQNILHIFVRMENPSVLPKCMHGCVCNSFRMHAHYYKAYGSMFACRARTSTTTSTAACDACRRRSGGVKCVRRFVCVCVRWMHARTRFIIQHIEHSEKESCVCGEEKVPAARLNLFVRVHIFTFYARQAHREIAHMAEEVARRLSCGSAS